MRFRKETAAGRIAIDMTPMIDVVFQLMIFFMLTLKIVSMEGDLSVNMPFSSGVIGEPGGIPDIHVRLMANSDGSLAHLMLGRRDLGNDDHAFAKLNSEILNIIGRPGNPLAKDIEVILDPDYGLKYQNVIQAISACTGRVDPATKQVVRYVEKVKFAPQRP